MRSATYSVVRYIADPARNEPLNVGILLWTETGFAVRLDEAAVARVVRENPQLERDGLLYLEGYLRSRLARTVPPFSKDGFLRVVEEQAGFPVSMTEGRATTLAHDDETAISETVDRLIARVVRPRRRSGGGGSRVASTLERELRPLIQRQAISRHHVVQAAHTQVKRTIDFFANSRSNLALDVLNLSLARADDIRARADQEAFKIWDVLATEQVRRYYVLGSFSPNDELQAATQNAKTIVTSTGGELIEDVEDARSLLETAAETRLFR